MSGRIFISILFMLFVMFTGFDTVAAAEVSAGSGMISTQDAYQYEKTETGIELLAYDGMESEIVIPAGIDGIPVTVIGDGCFAKNRSITKVTMPDTVTAIKDGAFWACDKLENIKISSGLESIGYAAFADCSGLKEMTLPASLETITEYTFYKSYFEKIHFAAKAKIKKLPDECFANCINLKEIDIPQNVTRIGKNIFPIYSEDDNKIWYNRKVVRINIMGKVKSLQKDSFQGISNHAVFSVPAKYKKAYKKLLTKQDWYRSTMKIK